MITLIQKLYSEALFRTLKYCPQWPSDGFKHIDDTRQWMNDFTHWYNEIHRHSKIKFVTPAERHQGLDSEILLQRDRLYHAAKLEKPNRWSGNTRNWSPVGAVALNPERDEVIENVAA